MTYTATTARTSRIGFAKVAQFVMPVLAIANAALTLLVFGASQDFIWTLVGLITASTVMLSFFYTKIEWTPIGAILMIVTHALIGAVSFIPLVMFGIGAVFGDQSMAPLPLSLIIVNIPFAVFFQSARG